MKAEESRAILSFVYKWIARPEFCTRVSWQPNQVRAQGSRTHAHMSGGDGAAHSFAATAAHTAAFSIFPLETRVSPACRGTLNG